MLALWQDDVVDDGGTQFPEDHKKGILSVFFLVQVVVVVVVVA